MFQLPPDIPTPQIGGGKYVKWLGGVLFIKGLIIPPALIVFWPLAFILAVIGGMMDD